MRKPMLRIVALLALLALLGPGAATAANYVVRNAGSGADSNTSDNVYSTVTPANANTCTLRAAIQQGNAVGGVHAVTFDPTVQTITLTASLPQVTSRFTFDGTNAANVPSGGRVVIDGGLNTSTSSRRTRAQRRCGSRRRATCRRYPDGAICRTSQIGSTSNVSRWMSTKSLRT